MSDMSISQDASRSIRRAIRLLVKSSPTISCSLANLTMRVRARVQSKSHTLPISCMVWRWRAWIHSKCLTTASRLKLRRLPRSRCLGLRHLWPLGLFFLSSAHPLGLASLPGVLQYQREGEVQSNVPMVFGGGLEAYRYLLALP